MKYRCLPLLSLAATAFLVLFTAVACKQKEMPTSTVRVDNEHYLWREDGEPYLVYQIPAGDEFVLDATGYEFDTSQFSYNFDSERGTHSDIDLRPNIIQILIGQIVIGGKKDPLDSENTTNEAFYYRIDWHSNSQQQYINTKDLIPVGVAPPLTQFKAGQEMIIEVGYLEEGESIDEEMFYPFWSGMIDIQE